MTSNEYCGHRGALMRLDGLEADLSTVDANDADANDAGVDV